MNYKYLKQDKIYKTNNNILVKVIRNEYDEVVIKCINHYNKIHINKMSSFRYDYLYRHNVTFTEYVPLTEYLKKLRKKYANNNK